MGRHFTGDELLERLTLLSATDDHDLALADESTVAKVRIGREEEVAACKRQCPDDRIAIPLDEQRGGAPGRVEARLLLHLQHRDPTLRREVCSPARSRN